MKVVLLLDAQSRQKHAHRKKAKNRLEVQTKRLRKDDQLEEQMELQKEEQLEKERVQGVQRCRRSLCSAFDTRDK